MNFIQLANSISLAQAATDAASPFNPIFLIPIMLVVMYFMVIRPQRKEEKNRQDMIKNLEKGDSVITTSGIHGKVVEVKDNGETVVLSVSSNTNITFSASTILKKKDKAS